VEGQISLVSFRCLLDQFYPGSEAEKGGKRKKKPARFSLPEMSAKVLFLSNNFSVIKNFLAP